MAKHKIRDVKIHVDDPESLPLCHFCDQPIWDYEPSEVVTAYQVTFLIHVGCAEDEIGEQRIDRI